MGKLIAAEDGGAIVPSGRQLKSSRPLETVSVRLKGTDTECLINARDFSEEKHEKIDSIATKAPEPTTTLEALDEDELRTMTVAALKELPHYQEIEGADSIKKKDDLIEALLLVDTK